ncbi:MAG: FAD-binding oxidoreductase [Acidimicrobiales bacterium]|nr:FAD-binding oxidoreductase [Acidimicrobiales bacterium]MYD82081.1 FAD-binding oxidoreductase [Acidimicrobiales bacterium]MYJ66217.1 FAD-binding oxidoreductase [Acidimicrobiales bacterium]
MAASPSEADVGGAAGPLSGIGVPSEADVVVIGAGVTGASIGYQLARHSDLRVAIIDARAPVGGISGRTFGQIRQHYSNQLMVRIAQRGFHCIQNWDSVVGFGDPGYARFGYMLLVVADQLDGLRYNIELGQGLGVDTRFVVGDEISDIEPLVNAEGLAGGAYEPEGGYIDVTKMVLSWLTAASAAGADVLAPVAVEEIVTAGGAVTGVNTAIGEIAAPVVIAATGAWARDLLDPLGVEVPIERRRLEMAVLEQHAGARALGTCITDGNSNLVIRPDMGRHIVAVAYPPEMPVVDDPLADAADADHAAHDVRLRAAISERLPDLTVASVVSNTSGAYDVAPDYHPILGWASEIAPVDGLYLAVGLSGHGLKLSPALGEIVAARVLGVDQVGDAPPIDISALRPARFADGDLMHLSYGPSARA